MKQKIYLMKNDFGLHKIGISLNPKKRAMEVSNSSGVPTEVVSVWESYDAYATEQRLHKHFSAKRKSGEWFKFTKKDIDEVGKFIENFDHLIPCVVDYSIEGAVPPCQQLKVLLTKKKAPKTVEEISEIIKYQYSLLNPLYRNSRDEYLELISSLQEEGFFIESAWSSRWSLNNNPSSNLFEVKCYCFSHTYPICTQKERINMEIVHIDESISMYAREISTLEDKKKSLICEEK